MREQVGALRAHEVTKVGEWVSADKAKRVAKAREAAVKVEAATAEQAAVGVAIFEREREMRMNMDVAVQSLRKAVL